MRSNLVLIGLMGSGKTTLGRLAAKTGHLAFRDTDEEIERRMKMTVPQLFARYGEPYFRALESEAATEAAKGQYCVIATGGGMVINPNNMYQLKATGVVLYLRCGIEALYERTAGDTSRPLLLADDTERRQRLCRLLAEREPLYQRSADAIMDTDSGTPESLTKNILEAYTRYRGQPTDSFSYPEH